MSKRLDVDQAQQNVEPDLDPIYEQKLSADNKRKELREKLLITNKFFHT